VCALPKTQCLTHYSGSREEVPGDRPSVYWEVDFTEVRPGKYEYRYLLAFVDMFLRWVEAFHCKNETAQMVIKKIIEEKFPRFRVPKSIVSDNGPAFVAQVSQWVAKCLGRTETTLCVQTSELRTGRKDE
jgi:transposase InsO family protein